LLGKEGSDRISRPASLARGNHQHRCAGSVEQLVAENDVH
jgi:hypothetical protein